MQIIYFLISFLASIIGVICGVGGGVIIKPVMDMVGGLSVASINFLSGCTVLSMSCYSVIKSKLNNENKIDTNTGTPLAIGAAVGGILGKGLFDFISLTLSNQSYISAIQAVSLGIVTSGTLLYTIKKKHIKTINIKNVFLCAIIGVFLGIISSFLGIGGGPINLVVLYFFFSMNTKVAAQNSLYIIFFSQTASLLKTLLTGNIPEFAPITLVGMVLCGIAGGWCGRKVNSRINTHIVDRLFIFLMIVIIGICILNLVRYF